MKTIYKYAIGVNGRVVAPRGAKFLTVHEQNGEICVWAEVDTDEPSVEHNFFYVGTGFPVDDTPNKYLGTAFFGNASVVIHVFHKESD